MVDDYDIIVLGSGVTASLLASELRTRFRLLVLDVPDSIPSRSYASAQSSAIDGELAGATEGRYGDQCVWNLDALKRMLRANGGEPLIAAIHSYSCSADRFTIATSRGIYTGRLVIDCLHGKSPIALHAQLATVAGFLLIYSRIVHAQANVPVCKHQRLSAHGGLVETLPLKNDTVQRTLSVNAAHLRRRSNLDRDLQLGGMDDLCARSALCGGIVSRLRVLRRALDGYLLYGAEEEQLPDNAASLTLVLRTFRPAARWIADRISRNRLSTADLQATPYAVI